MHELIIPNSIVKFGNETIGFLVSYIEGNTLEQVLKSDNYTVKEKIEYLKQIGIILEKMEKIRNSTEVNNFYLNDIHEGNFILNEETNKINVIDLDSCKIGNNKEGYAKYLNPLSAISYIPKYITKNGEIKISYNTELYCYIIMVII